MSYTAVPSEVSLSDIIRFVWASKIYVLGGLLIGLLLAYPATKLLPDTINRTVTLTIYPSGTPTDAAVDMQNQLLALLDRNGFTATPARTGPNLTIATPYSASNLRDADGKLSILTKVVADYRTKLLAKVSGAYFDLQQRESTTGRAETFVRFRSFQNGIADGSIDPVRVTVTEDDSRDFRKALAFVAGPFFGVLLGMLVAFIINMLRKSQSV